MGGEKEAGRPSELAWGLDMPAALTCHAQVNAKRMCGQKPEGTATWPVASVMNRRAQTRTIAAKALVGLDGLARHEKIAPLDGGSTREW